MSDRRRINGPSGGTTVPVFDYSLVSSRSSVCQRPSRSRDAKELRKLFLKTGLTPSVSGSAYLELEQPRTGQIDRLIPPSSTLKLACSVHGPRPLPRFSAFTPNMLLSAHVKFAPFATRHRRGYLRDSTERDLAVHLETALRGVIISDRWPKSGVEVIVTILEGEEANWWGEESGIDPNPAVGEGGSGLMSILSGCITVSSAAIINAGIDCVDIISGGAAALVKQPVLDTTIQRSGGDSGSEFQVILDPAPCEHREIIASCVVGYLRYRDEITEIWIKGGVPANEPDGSSDLGRLIDSAIEAAVASALVLTETIQER